MDGWMTDKERKIKRNQESPECCCGGVGVYLWTRAGQGEAELSEPRCEEHLRSDSI